MTVELSEGEITAPVSWTTPSGDRVRVHLPVGTHKLEQALPDGSNCTFTVLVIGNKVVNTCVCIIDACLTINEILEVFHVQAIVYHTEYKGI
jgi:hypothetical protein